MARGEMSETVIPNSLSQSYRMIYIICQTHYIYDGTRMYHQSPAYHNQCLTMLVTWQPIQNHEWEAIFAAAIHPSTLDITIKLYKSWTLISSTKLHSIHLIPKWREPSLNTQNGMGRPRPSNFVAVVLKQWMLVVTSRSEGIPLAKKEGSIMR